MSSGEILHYSFVIIFPIFVVIFIKKREEIKIDIKTKINWKNIYYLILYYIILNFDTMLLTFSVLIIILKATPIVVNSKFTVIED